MNKLSIRSVIIGSLVLTGAAISRADSGSFDPTTATTTLGTALTVAGGIVAGLVALRAGVMVWKKVKSFFSV